MLDAGYWIKAKRGAILLSCLFMSFTVNTSVAATTINDANKYAYGANIGWVNWQADTNNGANVGWISLSNDFAFVQTDSMDHGADSDGDGIADPWELGQVGDLGTLSNTNDHDMDGVRDDHEYIADTNPDNINEYFRALPSRRSPAKRGEGGYASASPSPSAAIFFVSWCHTG